MTSQNNDSSLPSDTKSKPACLEGLDQSKSSSHSKRKVIKFRSWNFQYRPQTDILGAQGVSTDERKL